MSLDLTNLAHYYEWADSLFIDACRELSEEEFSRNFELIGRSIKELAVHMAVTYQFLIDPSQSYQDLLATVAAYSQQQLLDYWKSTVSQFSAATAKLDLPDYKFPTSETETITVSKLDYVLAYTDHSTFHRGQLLTMYKLLGKPGINSDYYTYVVSYLPKQK